MVRVSDDKMASANAAISVERQILKFAFTSFSLAYEKYVMYVPSS